MNTEPILILPNHLEFITDKDGVMLFGDVMGPYHIYVRNKVTSRVHKVTIPYPPNPLVEEESWSAYFKKQFAQALKELNENSEC